MKYAFHPEAKAEFLAAIDYYEDREPGLGSDFAIEVHATIENILSFPNAWPFTRIPDLWCRASVTLRICVCVSRADPIPVSQASYTALVAKSGMIYESV